MDYKVELVIPGTLDLGLGRGVIATTMFRFSGLPDESYNDPQFLEYLLNEAAKWRNNHCHVVIKPVMEEDYDPS